ncbi:hypothetical protein SCLCIDRAFT_957694 [Scleroderma citrinum Foug A]|uniref:Uncharacterized protein n=1 Tax=Scleroderma citrinum Foug A TaxID=1036808 RepID=A0A0C3AU75_9AGAM|nr:hypothetical protein SCLCIDRAFT_957694 [Scleroderma citrinum Foug A]
MCRVIKERRRRKYPTLDSMSVGGKQMVWITYDKRRSMNVVHSGRSAAMVGCVCVSMGRAGLRELETFVKCQRPRIHTENEVMCRQIQTEPDRAEARCRVLEEANMIIAIDGETTNK